MPYDPEALQASFQSLARGDARLRAMQLACAEAEQANDIETAVRFHHALIKESVFSGDRYQALIDFPRFRALLQSDPALAERYDGQLLWVFKWVVEASIEFPQIAKAQVMEWFAAFRKSSLRAGYSLKPFYEKRAMFYRYCSMAKLRLDYEDFRRAPLDALSDGKADEWSTIVRMELLLGHPDRAQAALDEILQKNLTSEEVPAQPFGSFLADSMARGDWQTADSYALRLRPYCVGNRFRLEQLGLLFCYDAHHDCAAGISFWKQQRALREGSRNPFLCFWFDRGVATLLQAAADAGLSPQDGQSPSYQEQAQTAAASCRTLAARFDARNDSDYFTSQCPIVQS